MYAHRPTEVEIDLAALRHNYALLRQQLPASVGVLAVVKADAYGHGAIAVARTLQQSGADLFGVAIAEEGLELRRAGVTRPVLMLGGAWPGQEEIVLENDFQTSVFDVEQLQRLQQAAERADRFCDCHLKIDSGMGRLGVLPEALPAFLDQLKRFSRIRLVGVMTHLAMADCVDHPHNRHQINQFRVCVAQLRAAGFSPRYIHAANSAASFSLADDLWTLARPGIVLYGGQPFAGTSALPLRPVMHFHTQIAHLKWLQPGHSVSYGQTFVARRPTLLAAIPVGYADGFNRLLSSQAEVLIRGQRAPVAGRICMDWTLVDVTDVEGVQPYDRVTLLGCDGDCCLYAEEWAEKIGTISYEVFCQVSKRVPRVYLGAETP
ncbi:MAG: alanine racemase [Desulfuromonadaceae bacterium]|nr:alanine racemase [Desulfuromonadaceae bacterium]